MRLWLVMIDGTVPTERVRKAWCAARTIQAVYARMLDDAYAEGHAVGLAAASDEGRREGYSDCWSQAISDVVARTGSPAIEAGDPLLPPDTPQPS
jgi:hypothetical protein